MVFEQRDLGDHSEVRANRPLDGNVKTVMLRFDRSDAEGGTVTILYGNTPVGSGHIARRATRLAAMAGFSVGFDNQ